VVIARGLSIQDAHVAGLARREVVIENVGRQAQVLPVGVARVFGAWRKRDGSQTLLQQIDLDSTPGVAGADPILRDRDQGRFPPSGTPRRGVKSAVSQQGWPSRATCSTAQGALWRTSDSLKPAATRSVKVVSCRSPPSGTLATMCMKISVWF